jgi:hypothetical protein
MQGILYEESSAWLFLLVTCLLGGGAAWLTGRAYAMTWRSIPALVVALLLLGLAVRFVHHAMFEGTMFSLRYYLVDTFVLLVFGFASYFHQRALQMATQYYWLYTRSGPFSWRSRQNPGEQA